jgi:hypothetical protein
LVVLATASPSLLSKIDLCLLYWKKIRTQKHRMSTMMMLKRIILSSLVCASLLGNVDTANAVPVKATSGKCVQLDQKKEYGLAIVNRQIFAIISNGRPKYGIKLLFSALVEQEGLPIKVQLTSYQICEGSTKTVFVNGSPVPVELVVDMKNFIK